MENKTRGRQTAGYIATVVVCLAVGLVAGWNATRIDNYVYDLLVRRAPDPVWTPQSVVVAIDEETLKAGGGMPASRRILTQALEAITAAGPKVVASDVILADPLDETGDARLAAVMSRTPNLVLPCDEVGGRWEEPLDRFRAHASGVGHVHPEVDRQDGVSRLIPLEKAAGGVRRWALALEAFRVARGQPIGESPDDLDVGGTLVPAPRGPDGRPLRIRYLAAGIPTVSALNLRNQREKLRGKVVFVGITALSAARDRLVNPYGQTVPGVEVHAQAFETLAAGRFLRSASNLATPGICVLLAAAAGLTFALRSGWQAYALGFLVIVAASLAPVWAFRSGIVLPYSPPAAVAWLTVAGAASFQHFVVRRQLRRSESERSRYQQAIHFVAHEMRTPLTAIQGSSELMTRYNLGEDKRRQITEMINAESKRLARMIQTFLDVERLTDGQMELKREPFAVREVVEACLARVRPVAEPKQTRIVLEEPLEGELVGDRELMEYAVYNLLTNAIKYSAGQTEVRVSARREGESLFLAVRDQGIGMDAKELRHIFQKFYRTSRAEQSGEVGTGIGLSIVEQIVRHHGGRIEATSEPGKGSCFTMVLKHVAPVSSGR